MKYPELRGKIRARFQTQAAFAKAIHISACSLSNKLNGKSEWTAQEIQKTCEVLDFPPEQIPQYFFAQEVGISQQ